MLRMPWQPGRVDRGKKDGDLHICAPPQKMKDERQLRRTSSVVGVLKAVNLTGRKRAVGVGASIGDAPAMQEALWRETCLFFSGTTGGLIG